MTDLTEAPKGAPETFLNFPLALDLDSLAADIAILGIPYGMPYRVDERANDQSRAPDAIRQTKGLLPPSYTRNHYDFDLDGPLLAGTGTRVVDCGNVTAILDDGREHYVRAEAAARKIFKSGATLISLGGDHGIPIPVMRALSEIASADDPIVLVHVDAHMDWRDEVNGETEGYSSPIRRASEMDWIGEIVQIGIRGIGSAREGEVADARAYGSEIITAYELHDIGMEAVLARIPDGRRYYFTIDADGLDPTIMPAVMAPTPGGVTWHQMRTLVHGLVKKGRVVGMDLVEIAPSRDLADLTMVHAERLICNFIGATIRAGYYR
ncbi:MAG: agmatinase [Kiloniellales bacterium]|nr:agmatinase [Kiloniellales bacterium]